MSRQIVNWPSLGKATVFLLAAFASSCVTISIHGEGKKVEVLHTWGIPVVNVQPGEKTVSVITKVFGAAKSADTFVLGYLDEIYVLPGDDCEIFLSQPTNQNIESLHALVGDLTNVCILDEKEKANE